MKSLLTKEINKIQSQLCLISDQLYNNPELGDEEFQSMQLLVDFLEKHQFTVQKNIANHSTAFKATFKSKKPGPTIAYLAEYDALPEIGHGCGHNMIGAISVGAGVTLSKLVEDIGGSVVVIGTPAEETNGAKVPMSEQGVFDDVDVAMILHPADQSIQSGNFAAMDALEFSYEGRASHAASTPEKGINALDSVLQFFNGINALREHVPDDVRIHGIISEGGHAPNIVPEKAVAKFYIRSKDRTSLDEVVDKVKNIARGAALMTGATLTISNFEYSYDNMITNKPLSNSFTANLKSISDQHILPPIESFGSIDMGNVSKVVPAIHPFIGLNEVGLDFHTTAFADKTVTADGHQAIAHGALALAQTGFDIITNQVLLADIKREFAVSK